MLYTIGFAGKSAEQFFTILKDAGVRRVLDVRLHNSSQVSKAPASCKEIIAQCDYCVSTGCLRAPVCSAL